MDQFVIIVYFSKIHTLEFSSFLLTQFISQTILERLASKLSFNVQVYREYAK
jgi:hypothetical protein